MWQIGDESVRIASASTSRRAVRYVAGDVRAAATWADATTTSNHKHFFVTVCDVRAKLTIDA
jgi:hypothetical protein